MNLTQNRDHAARSAVAALGSPWAWDRIRSDEVEYDNIFCLASEYPPAVPKPLSSHEAATKCQNTASRPELCDRFRTRRRDREEPLNTLFRGNHSDHYLTPFVGKARNCGYPFPSFRNDRLVFGARGVLNLISGEKTPQGACRAKYVFLNYRNAVGSHDSTAVIRAETN